MASQNKPKVIALEEHYWDAEVSKHFEPGEARNPELLKRLNDLGELRIGEMDEAGIDVQVLSHAAPSTQRLDAATAVPLAKRANDRLHETVRAHPDRFAAFAALPTADPKASADELERTVDKLGFKGAMVHGPTNGVFFDDKRFWPIFERAQALDVPLYLHPSVPVKAVADAYYRDYLDRYPQLLTAAWGYTVETATQGIRMVLSGVFEKYPGLKIILGHLGESLPFSAWRIDMALSRGDKPSTFRETFNRHFWITTSGNFCTPALMCCIMEMGVDRILFSVDYPFVPNPPGARWMEGLPLSLEDRVKILSGNCQRLLKM
ncbi:MAG TPA: amidohydrolase family protein [Burkholderiales bacterium]|nr:amidohydrolase family protein [Burkholderiales bacterium]